MTTFSGASSRKEPNRLTAMLMKWFFRTAWVTNIEILSEHFRLITLAGDELRDVDWVPGQKIQIELGGGKRRTYTPISWDAASGVTRILVYLHGNAPSQDWIASLKVRDSCMFFGPRASLDLSNLPLPALIFGDETSFGLACAVNATSDLKRIPLFFEVSSFHECIQVVQTLGLTNFTVLVQRSANDSHLDGDNVALNNIIDGYKPVQYVLTGKASSILRVRQILKPRGIPASQFKVKAYWATGKTGLD